MQPRYKQPVLLTTATAKSFLQLVRIQFHAVFCFALPLCCGGGNDVYTSGDADPCHYIVVPPNMCVASVFTMK